MSNRMLLVEDEEAVAVTLRAILEDDGYQVETALTAGDALASIEAAHFDVALLDLRLGEEDGLAILSRLKETSPDTAALILTGYGSLETAVEAMRMGASDYLLKPCDVVELKAAIGRCLERQRRAGPTPETASITRLDPAAASQRARDEFLELAGHELKTPLSAVIGWAQYAQRRLAQGETEEARAKIEMVVLHSQRMARLVDAFTEVTRVQEGGPILSLERTDLAEVLRLVVDAVRALYPHHHFDFHLPTRSTPVLADIIAIRIILASLLENAAKFSPDAKEVKVRLTTEGVEAIVTIEDRGVGIPPGELESIFGRYHQSRQEVRRREFGGLGIGLYLSRALVEAHGGRIWVESAGHGKGSTFSVALPLTEDASDA